MVGLLKLNTQMVRVRDLGLLSSKRKCDNVPLNPIVGVRRYSIAVKYDFAPATQTQGRIFERNMFLTDRGKNVQNDRNVQKSPQNRSLCLACRNANDPVRREQIYFTTAVLSGKSKGIC